LSFCTNWGGKGKRVAQDRESQFAGLGTVVRWFSFFVCVVAS
jgi:hypothetical protein